MVYNNRHLNLWFPELFFQDTVSGEDLPSKQSIETVRVMLLSSSFWIHHRRVPNPNQETFPEFYKYCCDIGKPVAWLRGIPLVNVMAIAWYYRISLDSTLLYG